MALRELDVSVDGAAIDKAIQSSRKPLEKYIDALINNVGVSGHITRLDLFEEEWNHVIMANLTGTWLVSKFVGLQMRENKLGGSIINISLIARVNRIYVPGAVGYTVSTTGLKAMTEVNVPPSLHMHQVLW
ncbi:Glucose 1-dehydrogenase 1 [Linum grandiflorum]